jgi:hypothetical protein
VTLCLVIPVLAECRRETIKGLAPAIFAGFFAFKSGIVRQDDLHYILLHAKLAVAGLFVLACARTARDQWVLVTYACFSLSYGAFLYSRAFPIQWNIAVHRATLQNESIRDTIWPGMYANLLANCHFSSTWRMRGVFTEQQMQVLRADPVVSGMVSSGTVDDVPSELDIVLANHWRWRPRPVFQSYSAYTPVLDQLNASYLGGSERADHVIMQWEDIDGRLPLLDDAASWRALFNFYNIELTRSDLLVLQRRTSARYLEPRPVGSITSTWDHDIEVPQFLPSEIAMMGVEIDKSFWGATQGLFFRNSPVYLRAIFASGKQSSWRVTRANLREGAFISYLPDNLNETLPYFGESGVLPPDRIRAIRFETTGKLEFASPIRISWSAVGIRPNETDQTQPPQITLSSVWKPGQPVRPEGAESESTPTELIVRPTQVGPKLTFNLTQPAARYKTLVMRARLNTSGRIRLSFGRQMEGRGIDGYILTANGWIDVYCDMTVKPVSASNARSVLRVDLPDLPIGSTIEIAGIWASEDSLQASQSFVVYAASDAKLQSAAMPRRGVQISANSVASIPGLIRPLKSDTRCFVDYANGRPASTDVLNSLPTGWILISGWAIDETAHNIASAVYVDIDNVLFPAQYGISRTDVAEALKEPAYEHSGFSAWVYIKSGVHKASIRVVNAARSGYYAGASVALTGK